MELSLSLKQQLNQQQLQSLEILQLSTLELEEYLQNLAVENPVVDLEPSPAPDEDPTSKKDDSLQRLQ